VGEAVEAEGGKVERRVLTGDDQPGRQAVGLEGMKDRSRLDSLGTSADDGQDGTSAQNDCSEMERSGAETFVGLRTGAQVTKWAENRAVPRSRPGVAAPPRPAAGGRLTQRKLSA
jgi:hypothetical protein